MDYDCAMESTAPDWVSETRFGKWFLSTDMWYREVLSLAVTELRELGGARVPASFDRLMDVGCGQGRTFQLLTLDSTGNPQTRAVEISYV